MSKKVIQIKIIWPNSIISVYFKYPTAGISHPITCYLKPKNSLGSGYHPSSKYVPKIKKTMWIVWNCPEAIYNSSWDEEASSLSMLIEAYAVPKSNPSSRITPVNNVMNLAPAAQADPRESESFNRGNSFFLHYFCIHNQEWNYWPSLWTFNTD